MARKLEPSSVWKFTHEIVITSDWDTNLDKYKEIAMRVNIHENKGQAKFVVYDRMKSSDSKTNRIPVNITIYLDHAVEFYNKLHHE